MKFIDYNNPINGEFLFLGWKVGGDYMFYFVIIGKLVAIHGCFILLKMITLYGAIKKCCKL